MPLHIQTPGTTGRRNWAQSQVERSRQDDVVRYVGDTKPQRCYNQPQSTADCATLLPSEGKRQGRNHGRRSRSEEAAGEGSRGRIHAVHVVLGIKRSRSEERNGW